MVIRDRTAARGAGIAVALVAMAGAGVATPAAARTPAPHIQWAQCRHVPGCPRPRSTLIRTYEVAVAATHVTGKAKLVVPVKGKRTRRVSGRLLEPRRLRYRLPADAVSGRIRLLMPHNRWSNRFRVKVRAVPKLRLKTATPAASTVYDGNGMWIWYLSQSSGGSASAIAAKARAHGVSTVFVKSSDGTSEWSQFTPATVAALKAAGLHVCAWQFVYGDHPAAEATAGADAVADGADCLVIDAETAYEGKYAQARTFMTALRKAVGPSYPLGLTSFPYVDYHPALPYSVFLGPGMATFNLPQVYWKDIGTSVSTALAHTYDDNQVYGATIAPLGQLYNNPSTADVLRFRALSAAYGATGLSWWDWQAATTANWNAVGAALAPLATPPAAPVWPTLRQGSKGDLVVWAQEHLAAAGHALTIDGDFGPATRSAVVAFQSESGLRASGTVDRSTWNALLAHAPRSPRWKAGARVASAGGSARTGPKSARLPARRDEVPGGPRHQP